MAKKGKKVKKLTQQQKKAIWSTKKISNAEVGWESRSKPTDPVKYYDN